MQPKSVQTVRIEVGGVVGGEWGWRWVGGCSWKNHWIFGTKSGTQIKETKQEKSQQNILLILEFVWNTEEVLYWFFAKQKMMPPKKQTGKTVSAPVLPKMPTCFPLPSFPIVWKKKEEVGCQHQHLNVSDFTNRFATGVAGRHTQSHTNTHAHTHTHTHTVTQCHAHISCHTRERTHTPHTLTHKHTPPTQRHTHIETQKHLDEHTHTHTHTHTTCHTRTERKRQCRYTPHTSRHTTHMLPVPSNIHTHTKTHHRHKSHTYTMLMILKISCVSPLKQETEISNNVLYVPYTTLSACEDSERHLDVQWVFLKSQYFS